ncbi:MAG: ABC transporter permease subunit, partial [Lentisphaeria bacterium]|nr:ABC transporter permease subunit [Lentisphaeria bacterium]
IRYSVLATILAVLAGGLAAWWAKRSRSFLGKVFDLTGMLPLMIPGIVLAVGFLGMYIRYPWAASIFDPINNPVLLLAAAYAIRRVPYVLRAAASGLEQTPIELENAARNTGAGPFRVFLRIVLPLIAANLLVGGLFAFSFSMLEVSDSLILAQKTEFYPITKAIYELSQYLGTGPYVAAAFGVWAMAFLASALIAASVLLGKKLGALFRL